METLTKDSEHSLAQAKIQLESIKEMVKDYNKEYKEDNNEDALQVILDDPLGIQVRSDWHTPGTEEVMMEEYTILLCTGGPAVRITGTMNDYNEPETAAIEHQDWGTSWTDYPLSSEEEETVLIYARCFYFGGE